MEAEDRSEQPRVRRHRLFVVGLTAGFFVVCGIGLALYVLLFVVTPVRNAVRTSTTEAGKDAATLPVIHYRLLDGVQVERKADAESRAFGVMIENLPETRPQSGLSAASVVYEALAEGGSTRFLAVYPMTLAGVPRLGPVRSVRPYYVEWLSEYDGAIVHAGGSPDALRMIQNDGILDVNGIGGEAKHFWRDRGYAAPHNLFTSSDNLSSALDGREQRNASLAPWTFKDDTSLEARPADDQYIRVKFSGLAFETEFRYRSATNTYARFNAGKPHTEANTGEQLQAKNVIVQIIPKVLAIGEKGRLTLDVHGDGRALIFLDGGMNVGTWRKADRTGRTEFFFEDGTPAQLNRGTTWVEVVPEDKAVEYGALDAT